jgi:chemotaxis response regulator CheB
VPSINRLFTSVARACGSRAVGVVLSGCLSDGAAGSHRIIEAGGKLLFQDRSTALQYEMPWASLRTGAPGLVLPPRALAAALLATMAVPGASQWFQVREGNAYPSTAL